MKGLGMGGGILKRLCAPSLEMYLIEAYNFVFGLVNQLA